jgi:hypothetical protein
VRAVILVLLFVNLAFFAWWQWLAPKEAQLLPSAKVDAPRLQLATEQRTGAGSGDRCVTVGPFANAELATRARATLTDAGYASIPREEESAVLEGYWVFLEAPSTEAAERRLFERLRRGGITDAAAVGEGAQRRISLGIFSEEARAISRSETVARLQMLPQIEARETTGTSLWLDLQLKSDAPPLEGQKFPAGDTELEFRPCPAKEPAPEDEDSAVGDEGEASEGESRPA